jgi:hypothetical protein
MTRDIPPPVAEALRRVHRLVVQRRPLAEALAALDAVAELAEARGQQVAELIELERREAKERDEDRGPHTPVEGGAGTFPRELTEGIRYAFHHQRMGWPYEDVMAILDAVAVLPEAAEFPDQLSHDRILMARMFDRGTDDLEREIERALRTAVAPAWSRADAIMMACDGYPGLAARYMPPLIARAEDELRQQPDTMAQKSLDSVKAALERTLRASRRATQG